MSEDPGKYTAHDIIAMFDQFTTTLENFAVLMKTYHTKLLDEGFPPLMANQLVRDFQITYWNNVLSSGKQK